MNRPPTEADEIAEQVFGSYFPPPKYTGLMRAARIGRIVAEDTRRGDVPLVQTLRDIINDNKVAFGPPYAEEALVGLVRAACEAEGIDTSG